MTETNASVVIVGAGQAGGRAAEALRQGGHTGALTLIGDEPHPPYERPSLSKEFLSGGGEDSITWVRPPAWYDETGIRLIRGNRATAVDRRRSLVELADGSAIPFQTLILATGTRPRPLPVEGAGHERCFTLRTIEDSRRFRPFLTPGAHIVVVGAGFIGLEVAAAARAADCAVSVLEQADFPMARGVPPLIGAYYARLHRSRGVDLRTGARVVGIGDCDGRPAVHTADGGVLVADAVVVGIGVIPNVELAAAAGLKTDNGIVVDSYGRTDDPRIYAAGDVTHHVNPLLGCSLRLETWQNAQNQAIAVARNILGANTPYAELPWFWSDQFGLNLQIAGIPEVDDEPVARGTLGEGPALLFYRRAGRFVAVIGLDAGRDMRFARELIALGGDVTAADLANPTLKLADLCRALKRAATADV